MTEIGGYDWEPSIAAPKHRSVGIQILLWAATSGIYQYFWIYALHKEHPRRRGIDLSPRAAVLPLVFASMLVLVSTVTFFVHFTTWLIDHFEAMSHEHRTVASPMSPTHFENQFEMQFVELVSLPLVWVPWVVGSLIYTIWMTKIMRQLGSRLSALATMASQPHLRVHPSFAWVYLGSAIASVAALALEPLGPLPNILGMIGFGVTVAWWAYCSQIHNQLAFIAAHGQAPQQPYLPQSAPQHPHYPQA
ncbi:MAG: DUF4234 domain-containing protein [Planctomycetes bacterium]|nr:DUF4234 domain-containing protein [Planctomycetota bacterium]